MLHEPRQVRPQQRQVRRHVIELRGKDGGVLDERGEPLLLLVRVEQQRVAVLEQRTAVRRERVEVLDDVRQVRLDRLELFENPVEIGFDDGEVFVPPRGGWVGGGGNGGLGGGGGRGG